MKIVERDNDGNIVDLSLYANVIVRAWTLVNNIKLYSFVAKDGYGPITALSNTEYEVTVRNYETKTMAPGPLFIEIYVCDVTGTETAIFSGKVCMILHSHSKDEVSNG